jgi:hypothetical protein
MVERLDAFPGLTALGFVSAIQGAHTPGQVLLDVSAGARAATSLYEGDLPAGIRLEPERGAVRAKARSGAGQAPRGGRITGWGEIADRAETPPADVVPGALGGALRAAGMQPGYAGVAGSRGLEAIVAADRAGLVSQIALAPRGRVGAAVLRLWRTSRLLVAGLPAGREGRRAVERLLDARRPRDLVLVVQRPNAVARRLLAAGAAGLGGGATLTSDSTRRDGLVVSTDIAPTVLGRLGIPTPDEMSGEPIEATGRADAAALTDMRARLVVVGPRRWSVVLIGLAGAAAVAALLSLLGGGLRRAARCALLAALWLPAVLLATGVLAPSATAEAAAVAVASGVLAVVTDSILPWPRSVAIPAGVSVAAHLADLAFGSGLIVRSLLGPNPVLGARFYGIGNELEAALSVIALLGLGGIVATAPARARVWSFAAGGGALALLLGWGRLGADVGAVLTLGAGAAAGALAAAERGSGRARAALVLAVPALLLAALAGLDLATGGDSHFTRSVLRAGGLDELGQVAQRRFELSLNSLGRGAIGPLVGLAAVALATGVHFRRRLLAPLEGFPGMRAGVYGALAAVLAGALTNDSGPIIFLIGAVYLALAVGFVAAAPKTGLQPSAAAVTSFHPRNRR